MPWGAAAVAAATVVGSVVSSNAAQKGAQTQADAANRASDINAQMFYTQNEQQAPYREAGYQALKDIGARQDYLTAPGATLRPFTAADLRTNLAPNYEFMKNQGLGAITQSLNAGGGGSNIDLARTRFAEDYASNAYQNALSNYVTQQQIGFGQGQTNQTNIFNKLAAIAGIGQTSLQATGNQSVAAGENIGNMISNAGSATGAGQVAQGNIYGSAASNLGGAAAYGYNQWANANPYSNMGLSGSNARGFTYNEQAGPPASLANYNAA
jgi:hypothetical protein